MPLGKHFLIITDTFLPDNNAAAVQLYDLAIELLHQGNRVTVFTPLSSYFQRSHIENMDGINVVKLYSPNIRNVGGFLRFLFEVSMPFFMLYQLHKIKFDLKIFDGIISFIKLLAHIYFCFNSFLAIICRALGYILCSSINIFFESDSVLSFFKILTFFCNIISPESIFEVT